MPGLQFLCVSGKSTGSRCVILETYPLHDTHTHSLSYPVTVDFQLGPLDGASGFDAAKILAFSTH